MSHLIGPLSRDSSLKHRAPGGGGAEENGSWPGLGHDRHREGSIIDS